MNGIMNSFKRLFSNKNTVTIIGVLLVLVLLYWGYSSQVKTAVRPVEVPVASRKISPRTQINAEMIVPKEISEIAIEDNVCKNRDGRNGCFSYGYVWNRIIICIVLLQNFIKHFISTLFRYSIIST